MSQGAAGVCRKPLATNGIGLQHDREMEREAPAPVASRSLTLQEKELEATSGIEPEYTDLQSAA